MMFLPSPFIRTGILVILGLRPSGANSNDHSFDFLSSSSGRIFPTFIAKYLSFQSKNQMFFPAPFVIHDCQTCRLRWVCQALNRVIVAQMVA